MGKQQGVGWMERSAIHRFELPWIPAGTAPPPSTLRFLIGFRVDDFDFIGVHRRLPVLAINE
jgi:hypothetical protein